MSLLIQFGYLFTNSHTEVLNPNIDCRCFWISKRSDFYLKFMKSKEVIKYNTAFKTNKWRLWITYQVFLGMGEESLLPDSLQRCHILSDSTCHTLYIVVHTSVSLPGCTVTKYNGFSKWIHFDWYEQHDRFSALGWVRQPNESSLLFSLSPASYPRNGSLYWDIVFMTSSREKTHTSFYR